jgi:CheY-like chemotaxis protein
MAHPVAGAASIIEVASFCPGGTFRLADSAMRIDRLHLGHLRRALELYFAEAFRGQDRAPPRFEGEDDAPLGGALPRFQDESQRTGCGARGYALRLGNDRYPFMKLRLVEHLFRDEYFFEVDTHDQMFADPSDAELARLKAYNRELKCRIEAAWEGAGLPTMLQLKGIQECAPVTREPRNGVRILVVDDDPAIQETIAKLLDMKGYDVDVANDGEEAVAMADADRHALIVMDVEMPRMNGIEACEILKADPRRRRIPVLLATAGAVELARVAAPDGFLVKPFTAEALLRFLDLLLRDRKSGGGAAGAGSA